MEGSVVETFFGVVYLCGTTNGRHSTSRGSRAPLRKNVLIEKFFVNLIGIFFFDVKIDEEFFFQNSSGHG